MRSKRFDGALVRCKVRGDAQRPGRLVALGICAAVGAGPAGALAGERGESGFRARASSAATGGESIEEGGAGDRSAMNEDARRAEFDSVDDAVGDRPDDHGPISVMGDHIHGAGEWMVALRHGFTWMDRLRDGTDSVSTSEVFDEGYAAAPTSMAMHMAMLELMYAPTDRVTAMVMADAMGMDMNMEMAAASNGGHTMRSLGLADIEASLLVGIYDGEDVSAHIHAGLGVPIGTLDPSDRSGEHGDHDPHHRSAESAPRSDGEGARTRDHASAGEHGDETPLPYPMRPGAGSWALKPGATVTAIGDVWSVGAQALANFPLDTNRLGYRVGPGGRATAWTARRFADWVSASVRLASSYRGAIRGEDERLDPSFSPTMDPELQAGFEASAYAGVNLLGTDGALAGHRLALEVGAPVYAALEGPQMLSRIETVVGWEYSF